MKYLNSVPGCYAIKIYTGGLYCHKGTPDILCCYKGQLIFLETKTVGNEPTPIQKSEIRKWQGAGGIAEKVNDRDDAKKIILRVDNLLKSSII